jgi:hypothetical protein
MPAKAKANRGCQRKGMNTDQRRQNHKKHIADASEYQTHQTA